jgi:hypothetical protein
MKKLRTRLNIKPLNKPETIERVRMRRHGRGGEEDGWWWVRRGEINKVNGVVTSLYTAVC